MVLLSTVPQSEDKFLFFGNNFTLATGVTHVLKSGLPWTAAGLARIWIQVLVLQLNKEYIDVYLGP